VAGLRQSQSVLLAVLLILLTALLAALLLLAGLLLSALLLLAGLLLSALLLATLLLLARLLIWILIHLLSFQKLIRRTLRTRAPWQKTMRGSTFCSVTHASL
jgi:hypothetical protein